MTFAGWDQCVAAGGCKFSPPDEGWGRGDRPVTNVSWDDAKEFIAWLSRMTGKPYRLPTEAEWEYAARAGSTTPYWWGREVGTGHAQCAECGAKEAGKTAPAGSFPPNALGLYDTAGNAAEWVEDCWNPSYRGAPNDGSAWTSGNCSLRVLRGGSFADKASAVRSSARFRYDEDVRYYANGFRVARDVAASELRTCAATAPAAPAPTAAPATLAPAAPPAPMPVPFEQALLRAANDLFAKANLEGAPDKTTLIIDPLIDGVTGARSNATLFEEKQIVKLVKENYPRFEIARFSAVSIARSPVVLIGTFTAVNNAGVATGPRDAYRICLALANLGIYLANEALHHPNDDAEAFGKIDDFGLKTDKLAVKFLFQPGSTIFISNPAIRAQYKTWLAVIAQHADAMKSCLDIVGHTSATGIPALNDELSVLRAQYVKDELERNDSVLRERLIASGKGSRELIVGTGRDDASDALDRRVEFNVIKCGG